jgi:ATP-dependent helicase HrpA
MSASDLLEKIQSRLPLVMTRDREHFAQQIQKIRNRSKEKKPYKGLFRQLTSLEKRLAACIEKKESRLTHKPAVTFPEALPITAKKDDITKAIMENQVVIISGDTGSGKSTQIPKICLEAGRGINGIIGCTQPRRIAAITISRRIAQELEEDLGQSVGYKIRFKDYTRKEGYIKIMTDGILLMETQQDPKLLEYDTLIIDEAHERSLNIDFLLGILKTLLPERPDLKLIITSATLDTEKFRKAFDHASVIHVGGRMYPVELRYLPLPPEQEEAGDITYVDLAVKAVEETRRQDRRGDMLVFMPTEQDIVEACERLEGRKLQGTTVLPLFGRLSASEQGRVYTVSGPKIVVATNVAETSLTIPGIKYVIDTGLARISQYLPATRTTSLPVRPISRSSADQRKGRCGRVQNGICIRLYSQEDYEARPEFTLPEILRSNLAEVILRMIFLNLGDVASFPFIEKPHPKSIKDGFDLLTELGAVLKKGKDVSLTERGRVMARMPLDPKISRMILEARNEGCIEEVSVIAAALSIQDPRERPLEKAAQADQVHAPFKDVGSDFITLLNIWNRYHRTLERLRTQNKMRKFCKEHFLSFPRMREWIYIKDQIRMILREKRIHKTRGTKEKTAESLYAGIHKCILSGFLSNIAMKKDKNIYQAAKGREVMVFPGSVLFNKACPWIVAAEMVKTSRLFARTTAKIDPRWLEDLGGDLCRRSYSNAHWEKKRGEVTAVEQVSLFGLPIVTKRTVSYGPINPKESHKVFVQALVEGDVKEPLPFLLHNQDLVKRIAALEDKVRRRDILASEAVLADFYDRKLEGFRDIRTLKKEIKTQGSDDFLKMQKQDLILSYPDEEELQQYPDRLTVGQTLLDCSYKFSPGEQDDGVTVKIPLGLAPGLPTGPLEWAIPGLLKEKMTSLIKGLPKRYRKQLVPVPDTVERIMKDLKQEDQSLITTIARFVYQELGVDIPASEWSRVEIPEHLQLRVAITDHEGREVKSGRDLSLLKHAGTPSSTTDDYAPWKKARVRWEKTGIKTWDFGLLPEHIQITSHLIAYPGLEPADGSVNIRLFSKPEEALISHRKGVQELSVMYFKKELVFLKKNLSFTNIAIRGAEYFGGVKALEQTLFKNVQKRLFHHNLRSREEFDAHAATLVPISAQGTVLRRLTTDILEALHGIRGFLYNLETSTGNNREILTFCAQARKDLDLLLPLDFLEIYTEDRLAHLPRYLKALQIRAERSIYDPRKDLQKLAQVVVFVDARNRLMKGSPPHATPEKRQAMEDFFWRVEEFKVAVFAQELKTPYPVSEKRLQKKLKEIERMA